MIGDYVARRPADFTKKENYVYYHCINTKEMVQQSLPARMLCGFASKPGNRTWTRSVRPRVGMGTRVEVLDWVNVFSILIVDPSATADGTDRVQANLRVLRQSYAVSIDVQVFPVKINRHPLSSRLFLANDDYRIKLTVPIIFGVRVGRIRQPCTIDQKPVSVLARW